MAATPGQKAEESTSIQGHSDENFEIRGAQDEESMVESVSEIGGIALGAVALLVPGLGPVLTGGPMAGQAVGETVGHYLRAQMGADRQTEQAETTRESESTDAKSGAFFIAVDTYSDEEADYAANIMEQHGGKVTRMTVATEADRELPEVEVRYIPADAEVRYVARQEATDHELRPKTQEIPQSLQILHDLPNQQYLPLADTGYGTAQFPQFPRYPTEQNARPRRAQDGYALDPVAPLSPINWIDPNIGLGNYDLYDPATRAQDNSQPPDHLK
ncbi:hypothetical protein CIG75_13595 [Tumebacillus algifaecis]|uniref:Uncharacterized protein n=2 Tax=Tumebacillus algifaecis TaxID=1214604 RepID=A0A223D3B5_9BACL|nr:hypothetical protein CIG75_13595 [Tumebacillus algifaecis]